MKAAAIALVLLLGSVAVYAQDDEAEERSEAAKNGPALAAALKEAKVSLAAALKTAEQQGKPISGKFELEEGKLQLSIYTMKEGKYFEVMVDYKSGKIAKTEPITEGQDLAEAKEQAEAMAKAKRSLTDVVTQTEKANAGSRVIGISPEIEDGVVQADVELLKGTEAKEVEVKF